MVSEEAKEQAKESTRKGLKLVLDGFILLFKLVMIIITGFSKAITIDFFHNIKSNWHSAFKKTEKNAEPEEKKEGPQKEEKRRENK